jgi:pyruvate/2-oxoglutarate dehydrogenase complex dihydrolipoamide dehydrogenase (E3) component
MESAAALSDVAEQLSCACEVKDRRYHLMTYPQCFVGSEAVDAMLKHGLAGSREDGVVLGNELLKLGLLSHVTADHAFKDEALFYRFRAHDRDRGHVASAGELAQVRPDQSRWWLAEKESKDASSAAHHAREHEVAPLDAHNVKLLSLVRPEWINPAPAKNYNVVVIGAGTGGLVTAASVAGVGGKVALIERHLMGGDCLNVGCVPSKALIAAAKMAKELRRAGEFGIVTGEVRVDFGKVMERMRRLRADIAPNDSFQRFTALGADVFQGSAKFVSPTCVEVGGKRLNFARAVIATGARARVPDIKGIDKVPYLTNATLFNLTELPGSLAVLGGGPIGAEMAQSMARFGSKVTLMDRNTRLLPREDPEAAAVVQKAFDDDGIALELGAYLDEVLEVEGGKIKILFHTGKEGARASKSLVVDKLLVSVGRHPNVEGLGLEAAGVEYSSTGVKVNDQLATTNSNIFAVGDVALPYQFTHAADFSARMVVRNALFFGSGKFSSLLVPWATYTQPEVAHVGKYPHELEAEGVEFDNYSFHYSDNDRAILEGNDEGGFVKITCKKGTDQIIGATIVHDHAGDMISEISVAMRNNVGLAEIGNTIHPYPTAADAIRRCGDLYSKTRLTPTAKVLLRSLLALRR